MLRKILESGRIRHNNTDGIMRMLTELVAVIGNRKGMRAWASFVPAMLACMLLQCGCVDHGRSGSHGKEKKTLESLPGETMSGRYAVLFRQPPDWFAGDDARRMADNIVSHQSELGGWPKNMQTTESRYIGNPAKLVPTFDNGASVNELRFLARIYKATGEDVYLRSLEKGMDYIFKAQYPTGGWPLHYPSGNKYERHVTFSDNTMVHLMELMREAVRSDDFSFLDENRRIAAQKAFDRGISYILLAQIRVDGRQTAWCAQHDGMDYSPRAARSFEPVSISGYESVAILRLLMSLEKPDSNIVRAIVAGMAWLDSAKLLGFRLEVVRDYRSPTGENLVLVRDSAAPPLWARFYEIGTDRPIFADRDGIVRYDLKEIGYERRNGYNWLGDWPKSLLEKEYPDWKLKQDKSRSGDR